MPRQLQFIVLLAAMSLQGCIYHAGGAKIYEAQSSVPEGKSIIAEYDVKYICHSAYGVYFTDLYRSDGSFAFNVREVEGRLKYSNLSADLVDKYNLQPDFNFWQKYGRFALLGPILCFIVAVWLERFASNYLDEGTLFIVLLVVYTILVALFV